MKYQQNSLHWPEHVHDFMFRPFSSVLFSLLQPEIFAFCLYPVPHTYIFVHRNAYIFFIAVHAFCVLEGKLSPCLFHL